jgi:hypothetical protein
VFGHHQRCLAVLRQRLSVCEQNRVKCAQRATHVVIAQPPAEIPWLACIERSGIGKVDGYNAAMRAAPTPPTAPVTMTFRPRGGNRRKKSVHGLNFHVAVVGMFSTTALAVPTALRRHSTPTLGIPQGCGRR